MAVDFFEIGRGGTSRARKIDYSKALDPLAKKIETRVKESKAKTEALINSMPQGVAIDKVPEELRGQVTDFLAKNKQEYVDASRVIASGIRPTDQRYIDAMATINGVSSKFQNLSNQLEDIALKRQAALDGRDHSKGAFDWEISDHEGLANGSMYASFSLQDDGSFTYISNDGKTKKWSDYSNTFQTNSAGQEAYINLENLVINNASKGVEFNRKTYEVAFDGIIKTLKTDGARDFVFSDEKFLEEQTNEKFGTPEYEKAVSALRNKGNFESILKKYKKYAVDELSKVHITPYNNYSNRQKSFSGTKSDEAQAVKYNNLKNNYNSFFNSTSSVGAGRTPAPEPPSPQEQINWFNSNVNRNIKIVHNPKDENGDVQKGFYEVAVYNDGSQELKLISSGNVLKFEDFSLLIDYRQIPVNR